MVVKQSMFFVIMLLGLIKPDDIFENGGKSHYFSRKDLFDSYATYLQTSRYTCDECNMDTMQIIRNNGYPAEQHTLTTEDGYILTLHRIPEKDEKGGKRNEKVRGVGVRCPVLLQHGLLASSSDWVMQPPHRSLAYLLSDRGYDVWLGNARGNTYSRRHIKWNVKQPAFWRFSWNEMGQYDLPAVIDYILNATNSRNMCYVGHSMGTTMFWVMMHHRPEYNQKIRLMQALAPIAKVSHMKSPIRFIAPFANNIQMVAELFGFNDFLPSNEFIKLMARYFCKGYIPTRYLCDDLIFLLAGYDSHQLNSTALPVILSHTPAGTSTRTVIHYAQEVNHDLFLQFDWGTKENLVRYGQATPPQYDLSRINCTVVLYTADNDILADGKDVRWLADQLTCLNDTYLVPFKGFNHVDFLWAEDADVLLYKTMLEKLSHFDDI